MATIADTDGHTERMGNTDGQHFPAPPEMKAHSGHWLGQTSNQIRVYTSSCVGCTKVCSTPSTKGYTGWKWYVTSCLRGLAGMDAVWKCPGCNWKRSRSGLDRPANLIGTSLNDRGRTRAEISFSSKMKRFPSRNGLAHRLWADAGIAASTLRVTSAATHARSQSTTPRLPASLGFRPTPLARCSPRRKGALHILCLPTTESRHMLIAKVL